MRSQLEKNRLEQSLLAEELAREGSLSEEAIARYLVNAAETIREVETQCRGDMLGRFGGPMRIAV